MTDYAQEFSRIQEQVEEKKRTKVALEERKRMLEAEHSKLIVQLQGLGLNTVEEATAFITKTETELREGLERCKQTLQAS